MKAILLLYLISSVLLDIASNFLELLGEVNKSEFGSKKKKNSFGKHILLLQCSVCR